MTTKQMKHIYEANPESWIALWSIPIDWMNHGKWFKTSTPAFIDENYYKLVHIKHKKVLKAYLADNDVEIEYEFDEETHHNAGWYTADNFIENYSPDLEYRLKEKYNVVTDFNNTYCEATELHRNNIEDSINEISSNSCSNWNKWYFINTANKWTEEFICAPYDSKLRQIYYDTTKNEWIYTIEKAEPIITNKKPEKDNRDIKQNTKQVNSFIAHGFEVPSWDGEILKSIGNVYFGYVIEDIDDINRKYNAITWYGADEVEGRGCLNGKAKFMTYAFRGSNNYDLTPIKLEWYEYPENFPAMLIRDTEEHMGYIWVDNKEQFIKRHRQGFRLITKAERDSLFCWEA